MGDKLDQVLTPGRALVSARDAIRLWKAAANELRGEAFCTPQKPRKPLN